MTAAPVSAAPSVAGTAVHWIAFGTFVVALLIVDLVMLHRRRETQSPRRALITVSAWVLLGLGVGCAIWWQFGRVAFLDYVTAYVVEESLSIDNMFVFAVLFTSFKIPREQQHRVLFWGIFGAIAMRALFIVAGVALLERFHWLMYVFGLVLLVAALRVARSETESREPGVVVRLAHRVLRTTPELHGSRFIVRDPATQMLLATPLLVCLIAVEVTDIAFAIDSLPAVFGITTDPFIIFTSNAMAILGMRSLYLAIAGGLARVRFLHLGLASILGFIAVKMLAHDLIHVPGLLSLAVIAAILVVTAAASILSRLHRDAPQEA